MTATENIERIIGELRKLQIELDNQGIQSREVSLAKTNLQQSRMWLQEAIK